MASKFDLDLDLPKTNVFVTQLNDRDDEDDINQIPIIKESAAKLLQNSVNTLQKTLLLKKEVEVDRVTEELDGMRNKFKERMEVCAKRQWEIQKRQQQMKDYISQMEKYIEENEAKRQREIQKYQNERKLNGEKAGELERLKSQLEHLQRKKERKKLKLDRYKKYEDFLLQVLEILPANYLNKKNQKADMLDGLMTRYQTLQGTNEALMENLISTEDELEVERQKLEVQQRGQTHHKVNINRKLAEDQRIFDKLSDKNQELEAQIGMNNIEERHKWQEMGQTIMSINNLADKCRGQNEINGLSLMQKLEVVREYTVEKLDIADMVTSGVIPTSAKSSRSAQKQRVTAN